MFWTVLLIVSVLAGFAFDLLSFCISPERIVMTINLGSLTPAIRRLRDLTSLHALGSDSRHENDSHD